MKEEVEESYTQDLFEQGLMYLIHTLLTGSWWQHGMGNLGASDEQIYEWKQTRNYQQVPEWLEGENQTDRQSQMLVD